MTAPTALDRIARGLVVSCQAYPGEPMRDPRVMTAVAQAALSGGAVGIRAQGVDDLTMIRAHIGAAPLIGLLKVDGHDVFITPTLSDVRAVGATGADIIAMDGTVRARPDGQPLSVSIEAVHEAGRLAMADCASLADAEHSLAAGADCVGTTLAGYTAGRPATRGPDLELLEELVAALPVPVVAEGRIRNPEDARRCLDLGAHAVVVGTAITHPTRITRGFVEQLQRERLGDCG